MTWRRTILFRSSRKLQKWHGLLPMKLRSQYAHMAHVASDVERMSVVMFHFEIYLTCHRHLAAVVAHIR